MAESRYGQSGRRLSASGLPVRERATGPGRRVDKPLRLYQCPGCWTFGMHTRTVVGYECDCGERMTLIDLRERTERPLNEDEP